MSSMIATLLKNLGFKPEAIQAQVDEAAKNFAAIVKAFNERLDRQDAELKAIRELIEGKRHE